MYQDFLMFWDSISYPLYIFAVITFVALLVYSYKRSSDTPTDEIEDDPTGNDNAKKKFYKYM